MVINALGLTGHSRGRHICWRPESGTPIAHGEIAGDRTRHAIAATIKTISSLTEDVLKTEDDQQVIKSLILSEARLEEDIQDYRRLWRPTEKQPVSVHCTPALFLVCAL
jgi:hypothetical protein